MEKWVPYRFQCNGQSELLPISPPQALPHSTARKPSPNPKKKKKQRSEGAVSSAGPFAVRAGIGSLKKEARGVPWRMD